MIFDDQNISDKTTPDLHEKCSNDSPGELFIFTCRDKKNVVSHLEHLHNIEHLRNSNSNNTTVLLLLCKCLIKC